MEPVKEHLLVTRFCPERAHAGEMLSVEDVNEILEVPLKGVIPESKDVLLASNAGMPVIMNQESIAAQAYSDFIDRFLGNDVPMRFMDLPKKGFVQRILGR